MTLSNPFTERLSDSLTVEGVNTDGNGQFQATVGGLRSIESAADVNAQAAGGYVVNCVSITGNTVTFEVRNSAGTAGNELPLVTGTDGVTDVHIRAEGY